MPRDKTRPANPQSGTHREKTRPARQNSAVLAFFRSAGRKISRFLRRHSKQGEFSRADHHTLATQRTPTVQNSPGTQRVRPQPVQNSPSTAKNTQISPFEASREKIIPVETETSDAGRILSRRPPHTSHAGHTHWDKTLPARPHTGAHRYKTRPARQKSPILACFRHAGRKISRVLRRHAKQGEFSRADHHPLATLGTLTGTKFSPHAPTQAPTGTKLSQHSKKHPNQPIRGEQGENYPGRDPLETQTTDAGRILSRKPPHTSHAGHTHRYKTLRAHSV